VRACMCTLMCDTKVRRTGVWVAQRRWAYLSVHGWDAATSPYSFAFLSTSSPSPPSSSPVAPTMADASLPARSPLHLPFHPFRLLRRLPPPSPPTSSPVYMPISIPIEVPPLPTAYPRHLFAHFHTCPTPTSSTVCYR